MERKPNITLLLLIFISGVLLATCGSPPAKESSSEDTALTPSEAGKKIYRKFCIQCHGYDGTLMASGSKNLKESKLNSEERISFIKTGKGAMIAYEGILTEEEIEMVSNYVGTLQK